MSSQLKSRRRRRHSFESKIVSSNCKRAATNGGSDPQSGKPPLLLKKSSSSSRLVSNFCSRESLSGARTFGQMAMNPTTALPPVGPHHPHSHLPHDGVVGHHHGVSHPVSHLHSEVSFEEFSSSPFLDYSTSIHLSAGNPYAAVSAAAAAAAASGNS